MTSTLLIVQFVLAILLTIIILLQKSSSMGLGAYSGSNDSLFGAKGPANFLTKNKNGNIFHTKHIELIVNCLRVAKHPKHV